jgi:chromosome partitioning protein
MVRIAIVQGKGGSGKTTLAVNIAGELAVRGADVQLFDLDPQASAHAWAEPGPRPNY